MSIHTTSCRKKGFTLVETLVAISILLIVIVSPMTIAQRGIQNAYYATEQVTAVFLAQSAIETVRIYRDDRALEAFYAPPNTVNTTSWAQELVALCGGSNTVGCRYSPSRTSVANAFASCQQQLEDCRLNIDSEGTYTYGSTPTPSIYTRTIRVIDRGPGIVEVIVQVSWQGKIFGGATRTVELKTWVYDQYKRFGS